MRAPSNDLLRALRSTIVPFAGRPRPDHRHQTISRAGFFRPTESVCLFLTTTTSSTGSRTRLFTTTSPHHDFSRPSRPNPHFSKSSAPATHDRGPASKEDTQTDFGKMDIFNTANVSSPATAIDACTPDGFHLDNGLKTSGGNAVLLLDGEAFVWSPWRSIGGFDETSGIGAGRSGGFAAESLIDSGLLNFPPESLGVLEVVYPKPDLLIVGTGRTLWMLHPDTRKGLGKMGVRIDVMDTGNASAAYNLLATERGTEGVAAAFLPIGFKGPRPKSAGRVGH